LTLYLDDARTANFDLQTPGIDMTNVPTYYMLLILIPSAVYTHEQWTYEQTCLWHPERTQMFLSSRISEGTTFYLEFWSRSIPIKWYLLC